MYRRLIARCVMGLVLAALLMGAKCPGIPKSREITITVVTESSLEMQFLAEGSLNVHAGYEILGPSDLEEIRDQLVDADIDLDLLKWIKITKVEYGVVEYRETLPDRTISGAVVTVCRSGGDEKVLIDGITAEVYPLVGKLELAPIKEDGILFMNEVLEGVIDALKHGTTSDFSVEADVSGTSEPTERPTDFTWRIVIHYEIAGGVVTDSPDF